MDVLVALLAGLAVSTAFVAVLRPAGAGVVRRRFDQMWAQAIAEEEGDPFSARVLKPLGEAIVRSASRLLPQRLVSAVDQRIQTAGMTVTPITFVTVWIGAGVALPALLLLVFTAVGVGGMPFLLLFGGWLAVGGMIPWRTLNSRAGARTKEINQQLPDVIDMIVTSVEAGLGMQQAMMTVAEKFEGTVSQEFGRVLAETQIGRTRAEAMRDMAARTGSRDLTLFVRAMNQAEEMGFSIGEVLRVQSHEIRERKEQSAREQAAKIPVKIIIPTTLFMLPVLFILILTPVILQAIDAFSGK
ncbi:MAG: type II secretion system F family protein [Dehalococcoidia bacterium]